METVEEVLPADGMSAVSILQSPNSAATPVVITGNHSVVHDAAIVESVMKKGYHGVSHADIKRTIQRWIQKARLRIVKEVDDNNADVSAFTS
ncbi:hypothetical protein EG68_10315 [Paragonimus skrjabini miyazakii]|uniref:Uncharacterized protein n=1 Tax=Paragonimus skrjabini miyazakii TaxID=59628 RepID=A0A8S9YFW9_9TREM|nr:hypothetical protein EG68_10315 [Paragonimus skrjabini miyazakii]